jgi:putative salt-induced outer membrane protein YdiY
MKKKLLGLIFLGLLLLSPIVIAKGKADLGGKYDDGDLYLITSIDYSWETNSEDVERDIEFDYRYQDKDQLRTTNKGLIAFKHRWEFHENHYVFGLGRFDFNEFRPIRNRTQANAGWGYKILRTDTMKMSNELAMGLLHTDNGQEMIIRNSLWFFYKVAPKLSFTNKYLYEFADVPLVRNETEFNYLLTDTLKVGIKNVYTEDPSSDNIISFNLGYVW